MKRKPFEMPYAWLCVKCSSKAALLLATWIVACLASSNALSFPVEDPFTSASASSKSAVTPKAGGTSGVPNKGYPVSPEDELLIQVLDVPEASGTFRVSSEGSLTLPLLSDPVPAAGLTLAQLSDEIATRLREAGMVSHPRVTAEVKGSRV